MSINYINKKILFSTSLTSNWQEEFQLTIKDLSEVTIEIECGKSKLTCCDINFIKRICKSANIQIYSISSSNFDTIISASSLGLNASLKLVESANKETSDLQNHSLEKQPNNNIIFQKGTLRAGEKLEAFNDVLVVGDINPGAIVLAGGNIMIWGRLLGIAHAGRYGNRSAKITALQLRPVQLRIANKVARGPKEKPEEGFAEEARIQEDVIVIKPARST